MASFGHFSNLTIDGSVRNGRRYGNWAVAQSRNSGQQKLLNNRLKEIDREQARSLNVLSMEQRLVKKDHKKLLTDRMMNSSNCGEVTRSAMMTRRTACVQERVESWKIKVAAARRQSAPTLSTMATIEDTVDQTTSNDTTLGTSWSKRRESSPFPDASSNQSPLGISLSKRRESSPLPSSSTTSSQTSSGTSLSSRRSSSPALPSIVANQSSLGMSLSSRRASICNPSSSTQSKQPSLGRPVSNRRASCPLPGIASIYTDRLPGDEDTKQIDVVEECNGPMSTEERSALLEERSLRLRGRRAEIDRAIQSKVSRLKALSRVPTEFNLLAKTSGVGRSGQPQISLNFFHEQKEKTGGKGMGSRKTNQKTR